MLTRVSVCILMLGITRLVEAQTTQPAPQSTAPTTRPTGRQSAEEMLSQMLRPASEAAQPLKPVPDGGGGIVDRSTGAGAIAPGAAPLTTLQEGTNLFDRVGRLTKTDQGQWELTLESDGRALKDPPLIVHPNKALAQMEHAINNSDGELVFRVSGEITEYNGRNYILIQRASIVNRMTQPLK